MIKHYNGTEIHWRLHSHAVVRMKVNAIPNNYVGICKREKNRFVIFWVWWECTFKYHRIDNKNLCVQYLQSIYSLVLKTNTIIGCHWNPEEIWSECMKYLYNWSNNIGMQKMNWHSVPQQSSLIRFYYTNF